LYNNELSILSMTKDLNVKTIRFPVTSDQKLQKLADKCGLTKLDFFIAMVEYFYKSKKDPRDLNDEMLKTELMKRTDVIVSFQKVMERDLLIPLKKDGEKIIKVQTNIVALFNESIVKQNNQHTDALVDQSGKLERIAAFLQKMDTASLQKKNFILKFSEILEYYIRTRESLGMVARQVDKDNLVKNVRQQLQNL